MDKIQASHSGLRCVGVEVEEVGTGICNRCGMIN